MIRQAREMVRGGHTRRGSQGDRAEYHQGWLATEQRGKQAELAHRSRRAAAPPERWATSAPTPSSSVSFVTGLELSEVAAELTSFVPGRPLDDDASMLLRFEGGAGDVLSVSQIEIGRENDLRLSVFGTLGSLSWRQEEPNTLNYDRLDAPRQVLTRGGPGLGPAAQRATRLPAGHPEAFIEAFANIYSGVADDIWARRRGEVAGASGAAEALYPSVADGVRGVAFMERALESAEQGGRWTAV